MRHGGGGVFDRWAAAHPKVFGRTHSILDDGMHAVLSETCSFRFALTLLGLQKKGTEVAKVKRLFSEVWQNPVQAFCFFAEEARSNAITVNELKAGLTRMHAHHINV